ncbi:MAG: hypothetical protein ACOCU8_00880 [Patescibacteria group bacterium]
MTWSFFIIGGLIYLTLLNWLIYRHWQLVLDSSKIKKESGVLDIISPWGDKVAFEIFSWVRDGYREFSLKLLSIIWGLVRIIRVLTVRLESKMFKSLRKAKDKHLENKPE